MTKYFKNFLFCIIFLSGFLLWRNAQAATYYVDNVNDGTGDVGSYEAPFDTIAACTAALSASGGDTCFVRAGTYAENVDPKSGTEGHKNIYAAYQGEAAIITGAFTLANKNDVRIIGFEFKGHTTYTMPVYNAVRCDILNNYFHNTATIPIRDNNESNLTTGLNYLTVRGNTITMPGCLESETETCVGTLATQFHGSNLLFEYNTITKPGGDFLNTWVRDSIIRNNSFYDFDFAYFPGNLGTAHPDVIQLYGNDSWPSYNVFFESNYAGNIADNDAHFIQARSTDPTYFYDWIVRGNVGYDVGSYMHQLEGINSVRMFNNTFVDPAVIFGTFGIGPYDAPSIGSYAFNNLYYMSTVVGKIPYSFSTTNGTTVTGSNNFCDEGCVATTAGANCDSCAAHGDPLFNNYPTDFALTSLSPARNVGKEITTINNTNGSGTSFAVTDSKYFHDGLGMAEGDTIKVGDNNPTIITDIDYDTHIVTVADSITWENGDSIYWRNQNSTPSAGAWEYSAAGYGYSISLSPKSGSVSEATTLTATVTNPETVRFVEFWIDGLPVSTDYASPYTYSWNIEGLAGSHTVKAIAYALYADKVPLKYDGGTIIVNPDTISPAAPSGLAVS